MSRIIETSAQQAEKCNCFPHKYAFRPKEFSSIYINQQENCFETINSRKGFGYIIYVAESINHSETSKKISF